MALYDIRCKDVARLVSTGSKTLDEIANKIHSLYHSLKAEGTYIRDVLIKWNPLVSDNNGKFDLSSLGRAFILLPGREGSEVTFEERVFLAGVLTLDNRQRKIMAELITTGSASDTDGWIIGQTKGVLKRLNLL